jgi:NADH-quinone oxidoreductase subunit A
MLETYLPILVFALLGLTVGGIFMVLNHLLGPKRPSRPTSATKGLRFGITFYLVAMLFILFDIEVVFLYPVAVILKEADSVFVLAEMGTFVGLLLVAFVYVWRKGALDWK